jgi:hypothetical protein
VAAFVPRVRAFALPRRRGEAEGAAPTAPAPACTAGAAQHRRHRHLRRLPRRRAGGSVVAPALIDAYRVELLAIVLGGALMTLVGFVDDLWEVAPGCAS